MKLLIRKFFKYIKHVILLITVFLLAGVGYRIFLVTAYPIKYTEFVNQSSTLYKVDPALVYAVIRTESNFDENAKSHAGAIGLMQIMPATYEWVNSKSSETVNIEEILSPQKNIDCGTHLLAMLISNYHNVNTALCAYNAGSGNVDKWLRDPSLSDDGMTLKKIPYKETQKYVQRVNQSYKTYKKLYFKKLERIDNK